MGLEAIPALKEAAGWRQRSIAGHIQPSVIDARGQVVGDLRRWGTSLENARAALAAAAAMLRPTDFRRAAELNDAYEELASDYAAIDRHLRAEIAATNAESEALLTERLAERERRTAAEARAAELEAQIAATQARMAALGRQGAAA